MKLNEIKKADAPKKVLVENHYGSLVDPDKYRKLDNADKALYKYTADGYTSLDSVIDKLHKKYPFEGGTLYRGLHFDDQQEFDKFFNGLDGTIKTTSASSWTTDIETAKDFSVSKKTYFPTPSIMASHEKMRDSGDHMAGYGGVVLKTIVTSGAKGVDVNKSEFAKESEVILPAGNYSVTIVSEAKPFHRQFKSLSDFDKVFADIKAKRKSVDIDKTVKYLLKNFGNKLSEAQADLIAEYLFADSLKQIRDNPKSFMDIKCEKLRFSQKTGYKLDINVYPPYIVGDLLEKCSAAFNKKIQLVFDKLAIALNAEIKHIMTDEHIDEVVEFNISGIEQLKKVSQKTEAAIKPLKQMLSARYHKLNSREYLKTLNDRDSTQDYEDSITNIMNAMKVLH